MGKTVRSRPLESVAPRTVLGCSTAPVRATTAVSSDMPLMGSLCLKLCISFCLWWLFLSVFFNSLKMCEDGSSHLRCRCHVVPPGGRNFGSPDVIFYRTLGLSPDQVWRP